MTPLIRAVTQVDVPKLAEIAALADPYPWNEERIASCLRPQASNWLIAQAQQILGFSLTTFVCEQAELLYLCLHPAYQRQGYAQQLLRWLIQHLRTQAVHVLFLEVRESNYRAIELYKKMGFQPYYKRLNYYPTAAGREHAILMWLHLAG